jgi:CRP-like cAMP-binding protein
VSKRGEEIFKKGERARRLYILLEGFVAVRVKDEDECGLMGGTFKEQASVLCIAALLEPHIFNVTAEALRRTITLVIEGPELEEIITRNANIGFRVMTRLAHEYSNLKFEKPSTTLCS